MSGVEQYYNDILMARTAHGRCWSTAAARKWARSATCRPFPGKPLKLPIDLDLQIAAEEALEGKPGAIIAMDPRTARFLPWSAGRHSIPYQFAVRISRDEWNQLVTSQ